MTKLDKLNTFLGDKNLDIPSNRRSVDRHGANLVWLRKHLSQRNKVPEDIQALLEKDVNRLVNEPV